MCFEKRDRGKKRMKKKLAIVFPIIIFVLAAQLFWNINIPIKVASGKQITSSDMNSSFEGECSFFDNGNKIYDVKKCGAKGDGITDDSSIIRAIINISSDGDVIFFPPGTYVLNTEVQLKKNRTYKGSGWTTILKRANQSKSDAMLEVQPDGVQGDINISDMVIDGNKKNFSKSAKTGIGIKIVGVTDSVIENVKVIENPGTGIWLDTDGKIPVTNSHIINAWTYNNDGYGIYVSPYCMDIHIIGGDHGQNLYAGISLNSPSSSVRNSIIWATRFGHGIVVGEGAPSVQIMNTTLEGNALSGLYIKSDHVLVQGCKLYANSNSTMTSDGILVEGTAANPVENTMILNNAIYSRLYKDTVNGVHRYQINLINHKNTTVMGNSILYNGSGTINPTSIYVNGINDSTSTDYSWVKGNFKGYITKMMPIKTKVWNNVIFSSKQVSPIFSVVNGKYYPRYLGSYKYTVTVPVRNLKKGNTYTLSIFKNGIEYQKLDIKQTQATGMILLKGTNIINLSAGDYISFAVTAGTYNDSTSYGSVNSDLTLELAR